MYSSGERRTAPALDCPGSGAVAAPTAAPLRKARRVSCLSRLRFSRFGWILGACSIGIALDIITRSAELSGSRTLFPQHGSPVLRQLFKFHSVQALIRWL